MAPRFVSVTLGPNDDGRRVDRVARKAFPGLPLSKVYSAIRAGDIRVNGRRTKGDARVAAGDSLDAREWLVTGPPVSRRPTRPPASGPIDADRRPTAAGARARPADTGMADLSARIVFQSPHLLVVAKRRGELVHGPDSLETLVQQHLESTLAAGVSFRPGPVHRLDRNTTGLVVFAASLLGAQQMSSALRERRVRKLYVAVLSGVVRNEERWAESLVRDGGARRSAATGAGLPEAGSPGAGPPLSSDAKSRDALTIVSPVAAANNTSLVVARIVTGRTHQIRAHAEANGTPLLGDRKYGGPPLSGGYILHAGALEITEPGPEIGFSHLWTPVPPPAESRVMKMFGDAAVRDLYDILSRAHD